MKVVLLDNMPSRIGLPKVRFSRTPSMKSNLKKKGLGEFSKGPRIHIPINTQEQTSLKKLMALPESKTEAELVPAWNRLMKDREKNQQKIDKSDNKAFLVAGKKYVAQDLKGHGMKQKSSSKKTSFHESRKKPKFDAFKTKANSAFRLSAG